jgi:hypothetical protein
MRAAVLHIADGWPMLLGFSAVIRGGSQPPTTSSNIAVPESSFHFELLSPRTTG